jgi:membrane protease YdiL (CAAX protease family)
MNTKEYQIWFRNNRLLWGGILVIVFALLRVAHTAAWQKWFDFPDFPETLSFAFFLLFWFFIMSTGLIAGGIVWLTKTSWRELGWTRQKSGRAIGKGILGFIFLYINVVVWAMFQGSTEPPEFFTPTPTRLFLVAFFAFGLAAWVEENLYRGYLQPLLAEKMSLWPAILVQAAIFSAAHLGYTQQLLDFGSLFVAGIILGWLRKRDSSLIAPYTAHGLFWMMAAFMVVSP